MLDLVLYQPEIPPNTGNIIRLCANSGTKLHLVEPMGFTLEDKKLLRAGLDYHEFTRLTVHKSWEACKEQLGMRRRFALTTKASRWHNDVTYEDGDVFVLGPETRGLPPEVLAEFDTAQRLRLPMQPESRSLNLSNAAAVIVYEAWRQLGFKDAL
jgi:tRNA (cytidine/uridine-2'-O-)-methyltransferase